MTFLYVFERTLSVSESVQANSALLMTCVCVSRSVVSDSLQPHGLQPARLLCPWHIPGKKTKWVAVSFSRGSSQPRDRTRVSRKDRRFTV